MLISDLGDIAHMISRQISRCVTDGHQCPKMPGLPHAGAGHCHAVVLPHAEAVVARAGSCVAGMIVWSIAAGEGCSWSRRRTGATGIRRR